MAPKHAEMERRVDELQRSSGIPVILIYHGPDGRLSTWPEDMSSLRPNHNPAGGSLPRTQRAKFIVVEDDDGDPCNEEDSCVLKEAEHGWSIDVKLDCCGDRVLRGQHVKIRNRVM